MEVPDVSISEEYDSLTSLQSTNRLLHEIAMITALSCAPSRIRFYLPVQELQQEDGSVAWIRPLCYDLCGTEICRAFRSILDTGSNQSERRPRKPEFFELLAGSDLK